MEIASRDQNSTNVDRTRAFPKIVAPDLLLTRDEVQAAWELSGRRLTKLVQEHPWMRARRPGYQPYYPLRAVISILGEPLHEPTPRYDRDLELAA